VNLLGVQKLYAVFTASLIIKYQVDKYFDKTSYMLRLTKLSSITSCIKILRGKLGLQRKGGNKNEISNLRMCTVYN